MVPVLLADDAPTAAAVPWKLKLSGGLATASDVRTTSLTAGFALSRKPEPEQYADHPLELRLAVDYTRSVALGVPTDDDLKGGFGLDLNEIAGPVTLFLFANAERNPVANLNLDLELAPVGAKVDLVASGPWEVDLSFAPLWNYRSVASDEGCEDLASEQGGRCVYSLVRGSFRLRVSFERGPVVLKDVVEFLPALYPTEPDLLGAIRTEAILRDTATLALTVTDRLSVESKAVFTRDPLLTAQADCEADPENLLCDGLSLETATKLSLAYSF